MTITPDIVASALRKILQPRMRWLGLIVSSCLLLWYLLSQFSETWHLPFLNEDYAFMELARRSSFLEIWTAAELRVGPWFRPWSQGGHFWLVHSLFGTRVMLWHAVSIGLVLSTLVAYFEFVRRAAGLQVGGVATSCVAGLVAWGLLISWTSGVQDLWMILFSLLSLHAATRRRMSWASVAMMGALLSKETAAVLPAIATAWFAFVDRLPWRAAARETGKMWGALLLWVALYSLAMWHSPPPQAGTETAAPSVWNAVVMSGTALLSAVNLDAAPQPTVGWMRACGLAILGAIPLLGLFSWATACGRVPQVGGETAALGPTRPEAVGHVGLVRFGVAWAILGWLPLLVPSLKWHSYYGIFGCLGAWLAMSIPLASRPRLSTCVIIGLLVLRAGRSTTEIHDWGEESYVRRAGGFVNMLRSDLLVKCPKPRPHTRFYFTDVPSEVGFLVGDGPSLRIWYNDSTLTGYFWRNFRVRGARQPAGDDRFFRYDSVGGWFEVLPGLPESALTYSPTPRWIQDHTRLAQAFVSGEDWRAAHKQFAILAENCPESSSFAYLAGLSALADGDTASAHRWQLRATRPSLLPSDIGP